MKKTRPLKKVSNVNKSKRLSVTQIVLTSCVIGAIITGCFSLFNTLIGNAGSKQVKQLEYENNLHEQRYEELRDALDFFSSFKLYDSATLVTANLDSDLYSILEQMETSSNEYASHLLRLEPYLSDSALEIIEEAENENGEFLIIDDFDPKSYNDENELNTKFKEHLRYSNDQYDQLSQTILTAIWHDLHEYTLVE